MSSPAVLIATAKVRAGSEDAFAAWKARHDAALAKFPGFISSDIMPPDKHSDMWTIILNFRSTSVAPDSASLARRLLITQLATALGLFDWRAMASK